MALASALLALALLEHRTLPPTWNTPQAEVLFLGASHTYDAIDPAAFDRPVGRLSSAAVDLELLAAALLQHIDRWPHLEMVAIEIDDFTLQKDRVTDLHSDLQEIVGELHLWSTSLPNRAPIGERWFWKIKNLLEGRGTPGLYWRRRPTLDRLLNPDEIDAPFTRKKAEDRAVPLLDEGHGRLRARALARSIKGPAEPNLRALEKLVSQLTDRGIGVVLISYPIHEVYARARPAAWEELVEEAVLRARAKHDVLWLDHRFSHGFADDAFLDIDHLSEIGAAAYSADLAVELFRPAATSR